MRNEDTGSRTLVLNGQISDETWFGDEVTPGLFREELNAGEGDVTVWINSPGGDVFAAAQIYNMLMEYPGNVDVRIDGIAASAASVIAMAGNKVSMSPVAMMMIHNPMTVAMGDKKVMQQAIDMLDEIKESIINAYELKTGQSRTKIAHMMDTETWFNAKKAVELGFADDILYAGDSDKKEVPEAVLFGRLTVINSFLGKFNLIDKPAEPEPDNRVDVKLFKERLEKISH